MTRDILAGELSGGAGVVNPFADGPGLVSLADYPRLKRTLRHEGRIAGRHCAQKSRQLVSYDRSHNRRWPRPASGSDIGTSAHRLRGWSALPASQSLLYNGRRLGPASLAGCPDVGRGAAVRCHLLDEDARRISSVSGAVPSSDSCAAVGGRAEGAPPTAYCGGKKARSRGVQPRGVPALQAVA